MEEITTMKEAFGLLGSGGTDRFSSAMGLFGLMDIAEEEMLAAIVRTPERAQELNASFGQLNPPPGLSNHTSTLYRAYCREVLHLVATDQKRVWPTDAELILALCKASQKAPLDGTANCLYLRLFNRHLEGVDGINVFGDEDDLSITATEHLYGKQADTLYEKMRERGAR